MIFWVMLLTFVISIMTLSLYPREDAVAVQEKPLAEVPVRPFLDMHNMARQTAERRLTNGTAGTGGEILTGSNLPLYTQDDVSDFRSFLVCNTAVANCDLAVGTCTLTRQEADEKHPCNGNNNVVCLAANCEADTSDNPQNPFVCNPVIIGSTDGSCPNGQQAEIMNFVVTVAPQQPWWNDINYGPSQSPAKQLWNGQLFKLSGRTGNCGVIWGDQIAHPRGTTPINNTVLSQLGGALATGGNMICQSTAPIINNCMNNNLFHCTPGCQTSCTIQLPMTALQQAYNYNGAFPAGAAIDGAHLLITCRNGQCIGSDSQNGNNITNLMRNAADNMEAIIGNVNNWVICLAKGTKITLANGSYKNIEDINYDDLLLVWNFDEGKFDQAHPLWIKIPQRTERYNLLHFSDGTELKTIDQHRIFNKQAGKFTYPMTDETPIGTITLNDKGQEITLISKEVVEEPVEFYNIITVYHINCFANTICTSCRFNNLYPIRDYKFIKDNRPLVPYEHYKDIPYEWYAGLRLAEQPQQINRGNDVPHATSITAHVQMYISLDLKNLT